MPIKRRAAKKRNSHIITSAAVAAFHAGDEEALQAALGLDDLVVWNPLRMNDDGGLTDSPTNLFLGRHAMDYDRWLKGDRGINTTDVPPEGWAECLALRQALVTAATET